MIKFSSDFVLIHGMHFYTSPPPPNFLLVGHMSHVWNRWFVQYSASLYVWPLYFSIYYPLPVYLIFSPSELDPVFWWRNLYNNIKSGGIEKNNRGRECREKIDVQEEQMYSRFNWYEVLEVWYTRVRIWNYGTQT